MSGILDQKTRILDTIVTTEGRRQMFEGGIDIRYVSFSDIGESYNLKNQVFEKDISLNLESFSNCNDSIFPTTNKNNSLLDFLIDNYSITNDGKITSGTNASPADYKTLAAGILDSFNKQIIIKSIENIEDVGFSITPNNAVCTIRNGVPFVGEPEISKIKDVESIFSDKRLSKSLNFQYLPPKQKKDYSSVLIEHGRYVDLSEKNDIDQKKFEIKLQELEVTNFEFSEYTDSHDIAMQIFETSNDIIKKLDIIKYGTTIDEKNQKKDLYFVGKIFKDEFDMPTFVNIFTLVIE